MSGIDRIPSTYGAGRDPNHVRPEVSRRRDEDARHEKDHADHDDGSDDAEEPDTGAYDDHGHRINEHREDEPPHGHVNIVV